MIPVIMKLLGSGDVVEKGMKLIDSMHTSTEEEVAAVSKAKTDLLSAYQPFKLAQRYLALMFAFTFLLCFAITLGMTLANFFRPSHKQRTVQSKVLPGPWIF